MRTVLAMLMFIVGLFLFAGGLVVAFLTIFAYYGRPYAIDWGPVFGGAVAILAGIGCWWLSRAIGGGQGVVKSYRSQTRKRAP